jgi:AbrB family looped-hinge helix DNA binding protein
MQFLDSKPMTTNRRITIPENVSNLLNVQPKDRIVFYSDDNGKIYIKKAEA